ncbi:MAG: M28 family peptidase, partial [Pseudomonadota bacterium]
MNRIFIACLLLVTSQSGLAQFSQSQLDAANNLIDQAMKSDLAFKIVESLTTEVGPRMAGSEAEVRARTWAVALGNSLSFDTVELQPFTMPYWHRGEMTIAMSKPYEQDLYGTALGGSGASTDKVSAPVVYFRDVQSIAEVKEGELVGKIAFVDGELLVPSQTGQGYSPANQKRRVGWQHAERGGALGLVIRSVGSDSRRFPHTGMMSAKEEQWASIPVIAVSNPDADHVRRLHELGETLRFEINSTAAWKGQVESGNVVFELKGSEKPEEIVLIGAHLDSWDLGTGALDDGAGVGITTAAAELIAALPKRPKRTIRVVLFGAEEVGLLGAFAYAKQNKTELSKIVVATESDFGARAIWRLQSYVNPNANSVIDAVARVLQPIGIVRGASDARGGGPDIIPLAAAGVPTIRLDQNGMDYFDIHHTPDDTLDKIDPTELKQNVAAWAAAIYLLADSNSPDSRFYAWR